MEGEGGGAGRVEGGGGEVPNAYFTTYSLRRRFFDVRGTYILYI